MKSPGRSRWPRYLVLAAAIVFGGSAAQAILNGQQDFDSVGMTYAPQLGNSLSDGGVAGQDGHAIDTTDFHEAFEAGDIMFETSFNTLDGVGGNVGNGQRFTRVPRADLSLATQWAKHTPARATGPNTDACNGCHEEAMETEDVALFDGGAPRFKNGEGELVTELSGDDGAGRSENDAVRDPNHTGALKGFIERNAPHVFGLGAVQRLAEEITADLMADQNAAINDACNSQVGTRRTRNLCSNGRVRRLDNSLEDLCYGTISAKRVSSGGSRCPNNPRGRFVLDTSGVTGVSTDLVVRPFQWKGVVGFVRAFVRDASHNELGMDPVEIAGDDVDGDGDGVANEFTLSDVTDLTIYQSAQPRPVTVLDLDAAGLLSPPLTPDQKDQISRGAQIFNNIGCANCHKFSMLLSNPVFSEPSMSPFHRDNGTFPGGQPVPPAGMIQFDLTLDVPDNQLFDATSGTKVADLGNFKKQDDSSLPGFGKTLVNILGDLRRHNMGSNLAESIQDGSPTGGSNIPAGTFMTRNLWGLASSAPYLHDGRATTPDEAVLEHTCTLNADLPGRPGVRCTDRGEAASSVDAFRTLTVAQRTDLEAAAQALLLFKVK